MPDLGTGLAGAGNDGGDLLRRFAERIVRKVGISLRRPRLRVTEQLADDWQPEPAACADRRKRVAQVINARVLAEAGFLPDKMPNVPERL